MSYHAANGENDTGRWRFNDVGDVCIVWNNLAPSLFTGCYRIDLEGSKMRWSSKSAGMQLVLRGYVSSTTLNQGGKENTHGRH